MGTGTGSRWDIRKAAAPITGSRMASGKATGCGSGSSASVSVSQAGAEGEEKSWQPQQQKTEKL